MDITIERDGTLIIDDAMITFRNFAGAATMYNRAGDRNFALIINDDEVARKLADAGWNVKIKEVDDNVYMHLPVKIKFNNRGPNVYLKSGKAMRKLTEDTIDCLDQIDIQSVDMNIRPYNWELPSGKTGRSAYLDAIWVTQKLDRFADRFENHVSNDEVPF
jgi:hypothetical protein